MEGVAGAIAQRPVVERVGLGKAKQRMARKLLHPGRRAVLLEVVGAGQDADAAGADGARVQRGVLQRPDPERHIGAFFDQVDDAFVRIQFQLHLGVALAKAFHKRHDHVEHERRGRIDAQPAERAHAAGRHLLLGVIHHRQDGARMLQECGAFLGQFEPAGGPAQQGGLELFLEPAQRPAGGRYGQRQLLGRGGDRAGIHDGREGQQFVDGRLHS